MNAETVKLTGRDLLWYEARQVQQPRPAARPSAWKRHLLVVFALVTLKVVAILSSDGVEMLTCWLNDSRGLLGWP